MHYLFAGDIGDNSGVKPVIRVHRVAEPVVDTNQFNVTSNLSGVATYTFTYPGGPRDAETLMLDPWSGDIIIVSKQETYNGVYAASYPQTAGSTTTLSKLCDLTIGWTVGGDISPSGRQILIKTYGAVYYYQRAAGASLGSTLTNSPSSVPYTSEPQGEAVGWQAHEKGYYTLSEGVSQPIYCYASADSDSDGLVDSREVAEGTDMDDADSDDDGQDDGDEFIAGASPTNAASYLELTGDPVSGSSGTLGWYARTNRYYDLLRSTVVPTNVTDVTYAVSNLTVASDGMVATNLSLTAGIQYYRLQVRRESEW